MKKSILLLLLALLPVALAACNTIEGAGEDLSAGGQAVSRTARSVHNSLP